MSYRQIKWMIILIPMITIQVWEYVRHEYLHPFISMRIGNWLSALLVFVVTLWLAMKLFRRMEQMQDELNRERAYKAVLVERERIARELHDGIAQSLFLLSVKTHKLEEDCPDGHKEQIRGIKETVRKVHDHVRQAISNLRLPPAATVAPWKESIRAFVRNFEEESRLQATLDWDKSGELETMLSPKDKMEIVSCVREALMNIRKHSHARQVRILFRTEVGGWSLVVEDDGQGIQGDPFGDPSRYGLRMMRERAAEMGWKFTVYSKDGWTRLEIRKEGAG
ncbi:sensor histidine kinase [Effusibacillus lacus]|uniref:histidine kinase n=1 Tax=Effusibacillus lacus TaxID=1348429 RepID=A0A292YRZ7_9BACL|nr:histidine kinase [Effusibacillus lacus]TCS73549.1 two-component system nitrate/nitrite sensor histidine kinase NarQ [Effusibacillus lacus]GAX91956.1 two-component sensor histidine kinase [Effusibacillus lacus]